ncbi:MAG: ASCH domain-containing protein [Firmicutes bacterium]|nr:ASCH domain-containing protein [Bacillota bacterium]
MKQVLQTTGLFSIVVWAIFFIIGVINHRPLICGISALFFLLAIYRRQREGKVRNSPQILWEDFSKNRSELRDYPYEIWKFVENTEYRKNTIARIFYGDICGESYSVDYFEANGQPLPQVGQYHVVCDMVGKAYFVVETVAVTQCTFETITPALARIEGCSSIEQWKRFFGEKYQRLCERMEIEFSDTFPLLFEEFKIVYIDEKYDMSQKEGNNHA